MMLDSNKSIAQISHRWPESSRRYGIAALCCLLALLSSPPVLGLQVTGLQHPESFLADPSGEQYFISNANGDPDVKDNNGFITKLDRDGKVAQLQFIQGGSGDIVLHAPKGMAIVDHTLYVADLDALRGFDTRTGRPAITVSFDRYFRDRSTHGPGLTDVVHDGQGILYVSDPVANTIYRVDTAQQHAISVLVQDPILAGPRGLAIHPKTGHLVVASWDKGKILEVTKEGKITELVSNGFFSARFHNLDGIDFDSWGNMYIADFTAGKVWRMRPDSRFEVIAEFLPTPADISIDRQKHLILVPYHYGNAAEMNGLEAPVDPNRNKKKRTLKDYGFEGMKGLDRK